MAVDQTTILISDLEDTRIVLNAALNYFMARDMETAQLNFTASRPSPLTSEIQRVKQRLDGVLGDFLLEQHESRSEEFEEEDDLDVEVYVDDAEDGLQSLVEASQEALPDTAFAEPKIARQKGRRLSAEEAAGDASESG
jgi:hypothetical protein